MWAVDFRNFKLLNTQLRMPEMAELEMEPTAVV